MDTSDDQSDDDCSLTDDDEDCPFVLTDIGEWVALNPDRLDKVFDLELELPDEVDNIDSIADLSLKSLPDCLSYKKLRDLELNNCVFVQELPAALYVYNLRLVGCHIKSFSAKPINLERLEIINCLYVGDILAGLKDLGCLYFLKIQGYHMECLPDSIAGICGLRDLKIQDCINLKKFPQNMGHLVKLLALTLEDCVGLEELPTAINTFVNLHTLDIKGCSSLKLPTQFDELTNLSYLDLRDTNIQSLPSTITNLPKLRCIQLPLCFRLETLPNDLDLNVIAVFLPESFRLDYQVGYRLCWKAAEFSSVLRDYPAGYRLYWKAAPSKQADGESHQEESRQVVISKQRTVNTPPNLTQLLPDHIDLQNVPVKSKRQKGKITSEYIQQCFSKKMKLVDAAAEQGVSRSTMKRRLKELRINEWASSKRGNRHHSSKKKNQNTKSAFVSESVEMNSVDCSDRPDRAHASECSDVANQLMLPDCALGDAEKTWMEALTQMCSVDFGTNVIGETSSCITPHTVEDAHSDALTLVSEGGRHHISQESEGAPSVEYNESNKRLSKELIKSLMDEGISQEAAAERLNVDDDTINATQDQICRDNEGFMETGSVEAQEGRASKLVVKATYKKDLIRFDFLSTSSLAKLKKEVMMRLPLKINKMKIKYQDEDNEWVLLACPDDLQHCMRLSMSSENKIIRLIVDS